MNTPNKTKGFTLIELLVVIAIIGLLSSIVLAAVTSARTRAQAVAMNQSFFQLRNAIELYRADHNGQAPGEPGTDAVSGRTSGPYNFATVLSVLTPKYISQIPNIPRSNISFHYMTQGTYYFPDSTMPNGYYWTCGSSQFKDYVLDIYSDRSDDGNNFLQMSNIPYMEQYSWNGWNDGLDPSDPSISDNNDYSYVTGIGGNHVCITSP